MNPFFILLLVLAFYFGKLTEALILFAIVIWHESFHVVMAKIYGLDITGIELLPFGGVARLEAILQLNPQIEWVVAIVGPISNILLILVYYGLSPYFDCEWPWIGFFIQANLGMALFNCIPVLPLDGGRVLRSILVKWRGFKEATTIAAILGQILSVLLLLWGGYAAFQGEYNALVFSFAGVMLFWTARGEQKNASYVFMRYLTRKKNDLRLKRVLAAKELVATDETSLGEILQCFQPPCYHLIWVLDLDGKILGLVGELELIQALFEQGLTYKVGLMIERKDIV
ncbi:MAG: peptidase M50 [Bacillota bacterium]|nr:peptidase M50 [Bacillota bacterium]